MTAHTIINTYPGTLERLRVVGKRYAALTRQTELTHEWLVTAVLEARDAGANVTELSEASGLSRRTVYKTLRAFRQP
jgi:DNA-binding phage protein